ncbi:MAG: penicillin-binding protein 2 [Bryobacterales bacterium]|nr:penicillin-binding protein 2 [Bryobacterales bacterium]
MNLPPEQPERPQTPKGPLRRDDVKFAAARIALFQYAIVAVFLFLISGFWDLQVRNPGFYYEQAERNRIKALPIPAPRGKILDREGRVIVDNHSSFSLMLLRENLKLEEVRPVAEGLGLPYEEVIARLKRFSGQPRYRPVTIKDELSRGDLAFIEAHRGSPEFPEMELIHAQRRLYPRSGLASHLIGYVGEVSEAELNTVEFVRKNQGDVIGKAGVERQYNDILTGVDGQRQVVVDVQGNERQVIGLKEAIPGKPLRLTIDLDLQAVAELSMEGRKGAVVALDPRNGEVLAMVSQPGFDPSKFTGGIRSHDWQELVANPDKPLLNRAIQGQLAPGSTFKPIVALAALESGVIDDAFDARCPGGATFYGRYFKCHLKGGHGVVDLHRGIVQSCDVFFYTVGNRLGIDRIAEYAELVGLGRKTGIDLPQEQAGLVPSTQWKIRTTRQKWYAGETISVAIGQGALTVTPLQLAYAIGGLAMGGVWYTPHVVADPNRRDTPRRAAFNPDNLAKVIYGMYGVVNEGGTGARARIQGVELCGKTGTSQLASNEALRALGTSEALKDNAWFVGFAPREFPEIAVVALVEGGLHGSTAAAPVVRDLVKTYFDKKASRQPYPMLAREHSPEQGQTQ